MDMRAKRGSRPRGLTHRAITGSVLLGLLIGSAFAFLLVAVNDMRRSADATRSVRSGIVEAQKLEGLVLDIETGQRGFVITGDDAFLEPWRAARGRFAGQADRFRSYAATPGQERLASRIIRSGESLIQDYSLPLIDAARRGDPAASALPATAEGKRRVDALRALFNQYVTSQRTVLQQRQDAADANAGRAVTWASAGLVGSTVLIIAYTVYQTRAIVRPVRRAVAAAQHLAEGDVTVRMPLTGGAEIGALETSFNTMAQSVQDSRERATVALGRLQLLYDATVAVGTTLDVEQAARQLVRAAVPRFADHATVVLLASDVDGDEPPAGNGLPRQVAAAGTPPGPAALGKAAAAAGASADTADG
jgi:CHASE3 domain sensor protein